VFVYLADLQLALKKPGECNVILSGADGPPGDATILNAATLADAQLRVVPGDPRPQLQTARVFLPNNCAQGDGSVSWL